MTDERQRVQRAYDGYGASAEKQRSWDAANPGNAAIRDELARAVSAIAVRELRSARAVLDIGCGSGWWLQRLARRTDLNAQLHGLELLPERIETARRRVPLAVLSAGDARELPYIDDAFEVVTLFTVLSSMGGRDDVEPALHEARRVLAPGGVLIMWEPRLPNPRNKNTQLITRRLLRSALGGEHVESRTITLLPALARRLGARTERLYPRLARIAPLRSHRLSWVRAASVR
jgi:ubiquinone/menaquinone biosynthesis C-methylase UbiE